MSFFTTQETVKKIIKEHRPPDEQEAQEWLDNMYEEIERKNGGRRDCADGWYAYGYWKGITGRKEETGFRNIQFQKELDMGYADGKGDRDVQS